MKKFAILLFLIIGLSFVAAPAKAQEEQVLVSSVIQYKKLIMQEKMQRVTVYNALNLTPEQIEQKECLLSENNVILEDKFNDLVSETYKLSLLEQVNAPCSDVNQQKKIVNKLKKEIEAISQREDKQFKKILNHDQKSKYAMIKKLERRDSKKDCKEKDYYKSNPGLVQFGNI